MMYNIKIKNIFFLWSCKELSDIKSSKRNPMDVFEIFFIAIFFYCNIFLLQYFFKRKRSNPRWAVCSIPILITPTVQVSWIRRKDWHILTVGRKEYTSDQRYTLLMLSSLQGVFAKSNRGVQVNTNQNSNSIQLNQ